CSSYYGYRDLHSFPTRRSSDLRLPAPAALNRLRSRTSTDGGTSPEIFPPRPMTSFTKRELMNEYASPEIETVCMMSGEAYSFIRDRKSTRLNSSHVAISYAVFC